MRERALIVEAFNQLCAEGKPSALATLVCVEGSSYRHPGARMLVAEDGRTWGAISGGCLEKDVARRARLLIAEGGPAFLVGYETEDDQVGEEEARAVVDPGPSLGCGGRIEILVQRIGLGSPGPVAALEAAVCRRVEARLATVIRSSSAGAFLTGMNLVCAGEPPCTGDLGDEGFRSALARRFGSDWMYDFEFYRHALPSGAWADVLIERIKPAQAIAIFGDGHDVGALVDLTKTLGWHVTVIGSRPQAGLRQRFPRADVAIHAPDFTKAAIDLDPEAAAIVMGHNLARDSAALAGLLRRPRSYVGVLGPRRRTAKLLAAAGFRGEQEGIYSPVGLDIGGDGAEAIALAIACEIQAVKSARGGGHLRDRGGPIHPERQEELVATDVKADERG